MIAGSLEIQLMANIARLQKDMDSARQVVGGAMGNITKAADMAKTALGALGVGLSAGAFAGMVRGSIDAMDGLNDLSKTTRIAIDDLAGLKLASQQSGGDLQGIADSVNKLAMNMGKDADRFKALGISAKDPLKAYEQFADVFAAIQDPQTRAALGAEALGKSWQSAAPLLSEGGAKIAEMVERGKELAGVTQEMADRADEFNDKLAELGMSSEGFKAGIAGRLLPLLTALADDMQSATDKASSMSGSFDPITETFRALVILGGNVAFTFRAVGTEIGGIAAQIAAAATGDFKRAGSIGDSMKADAAKAREAFDAWEKKILEVGTAAAATGKSVAGASAQEKAAADAAAKAAAIKAAAFLKGQQDSNKEAEAYAALISAIRSKIDENKLELAVGENVTESQKMQIKLDQELASGKLKLSAAHIATAQAAIAALGVTEQQLKLDAAQRDVTKYIAASTQARDEASAALAVEYTMYGKTSDARAIAMVALDAERWKEAELAKLREDKKPITDQIIAQLNAEKNARILVGQATLGQTKALEYAAQLAEENKRFGLEYIMDDKARAAASLKIEDVTWQERIRLAGEGTDAQKILQDEYTVWYRNQAIKPQLDEQKKMWQSVEQTAHDTFISIFDSGKSAFDRLRDTLKNGLLDLLYQMTLKKWIFDIGATFSGSSSMAGVAGDGAGGGSGLISAAQSASSMYKIGSGGFGESVANGYDSVTGMFGPNTIGSSGTSSAGSAAGSAASMAAAYAAAVMIGRALGNKVSSGYSVNGGDGNGFVNFSTLMSPVPILGGLAGGLTNRLFGMREKEVTAAGMRGTLSSEGLTGTNYADWIQKGGLFRSSKSDTDRTPFSDEVTKQFTESFAAIKSLSSGFAVSLGMSADSLKDYSKAFDIALGKDQAANEKAITDFFAGLGDEIANKLVPNLAEFTKSGETASAALQRLAGDFQATDQMAQLIGKSAKDVFGSIGIESAKARERLIELSGGTQVLGQQAAFFAQNFLTEAERIKPVSEALDAAMASLGLSSVKTREQFKDCINSLDLTTEAGAQQYTSMMKLAEAFAQVHPAIETTIDKLQAMKDAAPGLLGDVDNAFSVLQTVVNREKSLLQDQIATQTEIIGKHKALSDALHSTLDSMRRPGQEFADRTAAQADIKTALAIAKAGGPLPDADKLKKSLGIVGQDASAMFATYTDYLRDLYSTQGDIAALADLTDDSLTTEQKSLKAMEEQIKRLDALLAQEQAKIDILKGIDTTGLNIVKALEGLRTAILAASANPLVAAGGAIGQAYQSSLGRAPDAAGLAYWQQQAANGMSPEDIKNTIATSPEGRLQSVYQLLLGRPADAPGLNYWMGRIADGASYNSVFDSFMQSDEYKTMHPFAVGINRVPFDMPALIHRDEAVVPAAFNPFNPNARANGLGGNTSRLEQLIETLTATVAQQSEELEQIRRDTKRQADGLQIVTNGYEAMRTA